MPKDQFLVALDVGSSKISCVVANYDKGKISVVGAHSAKSVGIKDGVVNNIDKAVNAIAEVLNKTEMMSGHPISRVAATISGTHIESFNSRGVVAISGQDNEIAAEDILRVNEAAQATSLPSSREIIHVIPREYIVDKQKGISDPTGMTGVRLEVDANVIHGSSAAVKNLAKCIRQVGVEVDQLVYSGYASAEAVLTDTEKELGTLLIDIGGGTMDMIIYHNGRPIYSAVLPIGGQHITNDIAIGLRSLLEDAEKVKLRYSSNEDGNDDIIINKEGYESKVGKGEMYVGDLNLGMESVSIATVKTIIDRRLDEAFKFVKIILKRSGYSDKLPAGIVLTGGTSQIKGIEKIAEEVFKLPVRVGKPVGIVGLADQIQDAAHSAVIGVLQNIAVTMNDETRMKHGKSMNMHNYGNKFINFIKSFLP